MTAARGARIVINGCYLRVGGGVRIHPENVRMRGRQRVQYVAQCVACAALTLAVWQKNANFFATYETGGERHAAEGVPRSPLLRPPRLGKQVHPNRFRARA